MPRLTYYFVVTRNKAGKVFLIGGFDTEEEARLDGLNNGIVNFDIKAYPTKNQAQATQYYKKEILNAGVGIDTATQRVGHERTLKRRDKHNRYRYLQD